MVDSYRLWAAAEAESGYHVYNKTGGLDIMRRDAPTCVALIDAATAFGVRVQILIRSVAAPAAGNRARSPHRRM